MEKVLTILAPGFEETEAVTVIDLLRRAEINVTVCGLNNLQITGSHSISIICDNLLDEIDSMDFNCLFLPGGQPGTNNLKQDKRVLKIVREFHRDKKLITAICAAPTVLHAASILKDVRVTSYPLEKDVFTSSRYSNENIVEDGKIITSRGVGTAIEFALHLIGVLKGNEVRQIHAGRILWQDRT
jgi:4-methyl-5(b-hydroxyethyl)-thiazole monophosphate biosynthesis